MIILLILLSIILLFIIPGIYCNHNLKANVYKFKSQKLPKDFDGFRIAHISDLHNCEHGEKNKKLLSLIESSLPDIIVITGDMIDSRHTKIAIAADFAEKAVKIAPCYYVSGNHEARMPWEYSLLLTELKKAGVTPLQNDVVKLNRKGSTINLAGAEDPYIIRRESGTENSEIMDNALKKLSSAFGNNFTILLAHRPDLLKIFADNNIDLCLAGHAHGGQIRLPFIGGLFAPNQGFFPKLLSPPCQDTGYQPTP